MCQTVLWRHFISATSFLQWLARLFLPKTVCWHPATQRPKTGTNHIQQNQCSTPHAVTHGLCSPEDGHNDARNMLRQKLIINIWLLHLVSFLSLHTLPKMHGHRNLKHGYLFAEMVKVYWFTKLSHNDFQFPPFNTTKRVSNAETNIIFLDFLK